MATYYVRKDGSDSNTGLADTAGGAWLTITKAAQTVQAGDTVNVRAGTYFERITMAGNGTAVNRITFNGELDGSGNPLTIIDGSTAIAAAWTASTNLGLTGTGAYENTDAVITGPGALWEATNLQLISQINITQMNGTGSDGSSFPPSYTGAQMLAQSATFIHPYSGVNTWEGVEALWGYRSSSPAGAYIRYRNGTDPNTRNLRWSPGLTPTDSLGVPTTAVLHFSGISYYTWNNFIIQGSIVGAFFDGSLSLCSNNIVSGGQIRGAHFRTYFYGRANSNIVRNASLRSRLIGLVTSPVGTIGNFHPYAVDKFWWGQTTERDCGVKIRDSETFKPTSNEISGCEIFEGSQGVNMGGDGGGDSNIFHDNIIHGHTTQGFYLQAASGGGLSGPVNWSIYNNIFYQNGFYTAIRSNALSNTMGTCDFANNIVSSLDGEGTHIALYKAAGGAGNPFADFGSTIWFTHNTFSGANVTFEWAGVASGTGAPGYRFVNNIFSMETPATRVISVANDENDVASFEFENVQARIAAWAQSAHRGSFSFFAPPNFPAWADAGNITMTGPIWPTNAYLQTILAATPPAGHAVLSSGLDLSQPFTIRGTTYPARPLYPPNYYSGVAPNMGAVQTAGASATISASPATIAQGGTVTTTWTNVTTNLDWIGLVPAGQPDGFIVDFKYTSSCTQASGGSVVANGSCDWTMDFPAGVYEFRLFFNDGFTLLDQSNQVTITQPGAGSLPGSSDIIIF